MGNDDIGKRRECRTTWLLLIASCEARINQDGRLCGPVSAGIVLAASARSTQALGAAQRPPYKSEGFGGNRQLRDPGKWNGKNEFGERYHPNTKIKI